MGPAQSKLTSFAFAQAARLSARLKTCVHSHPSIAMTTTTKTTVPTTTTKKTTITKVLEYSPEPDF